MRDALASYAGMRRSRFAYLPENLILTQRNHAKLKRVDPLKRPQRWLPKESPYRPRCPGGAELGSCRKEEQEPPFGTCALVGNSGIMRAARFGKAIDSHEMVFRVNQGPTEKYEAHVGSRTTIRLLNKKWVVMYATKYEGRKVFLPGEARNTTLLCTRATSTDFDHLASVVRTQRPDIRMEHMAHGVEARARVLLAAFREARAQAGVEYAGGTAPSTGMIAFQFMLLNCDKISIYGMGTDALYAGSFPYHYFRFNVASSQPLHLDSEQQREHPHHSFEAETQLMAEAERTGRVKLCTPLDSKNYNRKALEECGFGLADG